MKLNLKLITPLLITIALISGCSKSNGNGELANAQTSQNESLIKVNPKWQIQDLLKSRYKKFNEKNSCWIRVTSMGNYCVTIQVVGTKTTNTGRLIYVTESGSPIERDGTLNQTHVVQGIITLFIIEESLNKYQVVASSNEISNGAYGVPHEVELYRSGNEDQFGFILSDGDMHQGYVGSTISLFLQSGKKILEVATLNTSYGNEGACGSPKDQICDLISVDSKIETIFNSNKKYFDIKVETTKESKEMGKTSKKTEQTTIIKFDDSKFIYQIGNANNPYNGLEY